MFELSIVLKNCNIVDVENGKVLQDSEVAIQGERIASISSRRGTSDEKTIDMKGQYVLPGLFNVHCNLCHEFPFSHQNLDESAAATALRIYRAALSALEGGITTLRTCGEINRGDIYVRDYINKGKLIGPRILASGKAITVSGGHGTGLGSTVADGPDEFRKAARYELAMGADHLKIFITGGLAKTTETFEEKQMTREEIEAVTSVASSKGTYVVAHSGGSGAIRDAAEAGVASFEHAYSLDRETARLLKEKNCFLTPTLSVTRSPVWMKDNGMDSRRALAAGPAHLESIKNAVQAGVQIVTGTDLPPGDLNDGVNVTVREVEFLVTAGLSPLEALRASTIRAAKLLRIDKEVGLIKESYYADIVAVPENPLDDVKALQNIGFIMKGGKIIKNQILRVD